MGVGHAGVLLAHQLHRGAVNSVNAHHVGGINRIDLYGQARPQIHAEGVVGYEQQCVGRKDGCEKFADDLGIGISQVGVVELPYLGIQLGCCLAGTIKIAAGTGHNGRHTGGGIDFPGRHGKFGSCIVQHPTFMRNVCKQFCHYLSPPLAFKSSISLSIFSSMLPSRISAPSPNTGVK